MNKNEQIKLELLNELFRCGELRRSEFCVSRGWRPASVFTAINELKEAGMLAEPERTTVKTGRHSPRLVLNPGFGYFIGLEMQTRRGFGVVIDAAGTICSKAEIVVSEQVNAKKAPELLTQLLTRLRRESDVIPIRGLGFADPGLVDVKNQFSLQAVNIPGWKNVDSVDLLRRLSVIDEILIMPETMARTYAEYQARMPNPPESLFQLSLNSGIGGGFIKNGELFVGDTGRAMEIGHLVVAPDGPQCQCGNRGCLEAVAGENGIRNKISQMIVNRVHTEMLVENFSLPSFVDAVKKRDRAAMLLSVEICDHIADALTSVVALLNPTTIVISGELTGLGDILRDSLRKTLAFRCFPGATDRLKVEFSQLDEYAAAYAAAITVRNRFLTKWR